MGLFDLISGKGMDAYVEEAKAQGIALLDVREPSEFVGGHVEGAINIPLDAIAQAAEVFPDKHAAIYVYCHSGMRSAKAARELGDMGFDQVKNIGGIASFHGPVVSGE